MAYDKLESEKLILRDYLATERTHLANERTLLAYLRTAFIVFVAALTFLKLFEYHWVIGMAALSLIPVALFIGTFGVYRFLRTKKKLAMFEKSTC